MKRRSSLADLAGHSMTSVILLVLLVVGGYHSYLICLDQKQDCRRKQAELVVVEQQIREARAANTILEKKRERLLTAEGMEEVAREKLGMVRPGEIAYVVEPGPPEAGTAEPLAPPAPASPAPGLVQRVLDRLLF